MWALLAILVAFQSVVSLIIYKGVKNMAESLQQLDAVIAGLGTGVNQLITDTNALIAAVQAIPGQDFTNEVTAIQTDITNLQTLDTSVTAETGTLGGAPPAVKPA
jgi:hypothetical protein